MNSKIAGGMNKMFIAQVGAICCTVLMVIPVVSLIGAIGVIVFAVISLIGLWAAGQEVPGCKKAFILTLVNALCSVLTQVPAVGKVFELAGDVLSFLIVYLVCTSLAEVLRGGGAADVASTGDKVWKINLVCYAAMLVLAVLSWIPGLAGAANVLQTVVSLVSLVGGILYMIFLYKGSKALA